jgi:hypothetical protein
MIYQSMYLHDIEVVSRRIANAKAVIKMPEEIARGLNSIIDVKHEVRYWYRANTAPGNDHRELKNTTHKENTNQWRRARKRIYLYPPSVPKTAKPSTLTDAVCTPHKGSAAAESHTMAASRIEANIEANPKANDTTVNYSQQKHDEDDSTHFTMSTSMQMQDSTQQERPAKDHVSPDDGSERKKQAKNEGLPKLQENENISEQLPLDATTSPHGNDEGSESDHENSITVLQTKAKRKPNLKRKQNKKSKTKLKQKEEALDRLPAMVEHDGGQYLLDRGATLQARASGRGMQNIWGEGGNGSEGDLGQESVMKEGSMIKQEISEKEDPTTKGEDERVADSQKDDDTTAAGPASAEAVAQAGTAWASSHSRK